MFGVVEHFDEHRGDGFIVGDDGVSYYLHCVEITDGSRCVATGARVSFDRRPGLLGRDEACRAQPLATTTESRT